MCDLASDHLELAGILTEQSSEVNLFDDSGVLFAKRQTCRIIRPQFRIMTIYVTQFRCPCLPKIKMHKQE